MIKQLIESLEELEKECEEIAERNLNTPNGLVDGGQVLGLRLAIKKVKQLQAEVRCENCNKGSSYILGEEIEDGVYCSELKSKGGNSPFRSKDGYCELWEEKG